MTARRLRALALILILAAALSACGGEAQAPPPLPPSQRATQQLGSVTEACDAYSGFQEAFAGIYQIDSLDGLTAHYRTVIAPRLLALESSMPIAIRDRLRKVIAGTREFGETGNSGALFGEDFTKAHDEVDSYFFERCVGNRAQVTALDYSFENLPARLAPGRLNILFTNAGAEPHELVVVTRNPGVVEPFEQLLAQPKEQARSKVRFVSSTFAPPGAKSAVFTDLPPGQYAIVCLLQQGATSANPAGGTGRPQHFKLGQLREFTVG